jgi:mono/diheme cytochrome c family protein
MRRYALLLTVLAVPILLALIAAFLVLLAQQGGLEPFRVPSHGSTPRASAEAIERGRYLATLGNCAGCHTAPGADALAGGRAFRTDYGTVYSTNLTPHPEHGIGAWSTEEFRHAMRHGVSRNGVLAPVFPYASFRRLDDADLDALLVYLRSMPASATPRQRNAFQFPANLPGAMAAWRLLYFRPSKAVALAEATLARGAYLVEGIGHCATCHGARGSFASQTGGRRLWGARNAGWFAPALHGSSLQRFEQGEIAAYLQGDAPRAIGGYGLMADVVAANLQHLTEHDAQAIETYLRTLPAPPPRGAPRLQVRASTVSLANGRSLYTRHCVDCHGESGQGESHTYPALNGSPAITQDDPVNLIKLILFGAVAPSTPSNPSPYTMPPFAQVLTAEEVAALATVLRQQQNQEAMPVDAELVRVLGGIE